MSPEGGEAERARRRLALIGAAAHAPGLWLLARAKLPSPLVRRNAIALGLTLAAMAAAGAALPEGRRGLGVFAAWLIGHCAWSASLARAALRGELDVAGQNSTE